MAAIEYIHSTHWGRLTIPIAPDNCVYSFYLSCYVFKTLLDTVWALPVKRVWLGVRKVWLNGKGCGL